MVEKIRKIYLSKTLFIVSSAIAVCCYLIDAIQAIVNGVSSDYAWILIALVLMLQWAFFTGQINVQKMLFGAILLDMIIEPCSLLKLDIAYGNPAIGIDVAVLVFSIVVFICHIYQQMDHKGKSMTVLINQLLGLIAFFFALTAVVNLFYAPTMFSSYVFLFGYAANTIMIICMETRVETYKQIRDKARSEGTWTEENRQEAKKLFKLM